MAIELGSDCPVAMFTLQCPDAHPSGQGLPHEPSSVGCGLPPKPKKSPPAPNKAPPADVSPPDAGAPPEPKLPPAPASTPALDPPAPGTKTQRFDAQVSPSSQVPLP